MRMKVKVSYMPEEEREATKVLKSLLNVLSGVKVRKSDRNPPFKHIYVATQMRKKPDVSRENS